MSGSAAPALRPHGYFRKREKTRARLLEAAKRVMAGKGVEATTIAEIAAAADVAPGTFYNYFTTREEILDAVATSLVEEFRRVMSAIQRTVDDPAERISIAIRPIPSLGRAAPGKSGAAGGKARARSRG